ncbi:CBM6-containing protein [Ophiocordyceps camponoti-floridani]|uniref:CBM6-containing protein n=1 Tax=Ophiocordyceps camponoti-floridani TaxID=2030778 RepID=A0A8H4Q3S0_9HYPO|nr:CBM6-containing protein [Ophiocordyceps camponoti-floridani]
MAISPTLDVVLRNDSNDGVELYAHVTGRDDKGLMLLAADGRTLYRPQSPSSTLQPVQADCAIKLGGGGGSRTVKMPRISAARIWFSKKRPLTFFINPGPALVEPSATNRSDANYHLDWGFCEFTWNEQELYANVSFVDFVSLPISLRLVTGTGEVKTVPGLAADGRDRIAAALEQQAARDGRGWDKLVIRPDDGSTSPLRVLSPNAGGVLVPGLFDGYYRHYVDAVWRRYEAEDLTIDTQFTWGKARGRVRGGRLDFGRCSFSRPESADVFSCSTGPFAAGPDGDASEQMLRLNIGARLAAALNRSTLLANADQPDGESVDRYYRESVTNHYARACHDAALEGRGYAFPYDDVGPAGGKDQSGFVNDGNPKLLTVAVGRPMVE